MQRETVYISGPELTWDEQGLMVLSLLQKWIDNGPQQGRGSTAATRLQRDENGPMLTVESGRAKMRLHIDQKAPGCTITAPGSLRAFLWVTQQDREPKCWGALAKDGEKYPVIVPTALAAFPETGEVAGVELTETTSQPLALVFALFYHIAGTSKGGAA